MKADSSNYLRVTYTRVKRSKEEYLQYTKQKQLVTIGGKPVAVLNGPRDIDVGK